MPKVKTLSDINYRLIERARTLFHEQQLAVYQRTDRLFAILLVGQWLAGIVIALWVSPRVWSGQYSDIHIHVWMAFVLGFLIIVFPVSLAIARPGHALTRYVIAIGQMLYSALLIHLTGGRIETHFHIFGSLAFLSFYRDWRVFVPATVVVVGDHVLRGFFFPLSIYGVTAIEPWRWVEHAWWVVFEVVFLVKTCLDNVKEMWSNAHRQAEVEVTRAEVEELVFIRTEKLKASERSLSAEYAVTRILADSTTLAEAAPKILESIVSTLLTDAGLVWGAVWDRDAESKRMRQIHQLQFHSQSWGDLLSTCELKRMHKVDLPARVLLSSTVVQMENLSGGEMSSAFAFPLVSNKKVIGAIEFFMQEPFGLDSLEISIMESLGKQIGQFIVRKQAESENVKLAYMVQSCGEPIIGQTPDGFITSWNSGAERVFGYKAEEVLGKSGSILAPSDKDEELCRLRESGKRGQIVENIETTRVSKDGRTIDVLLTRSPVFDDKHRIIGISALFRDITERKAARRRVKEFHSMVSHELRTPLASICGSLDLISGGVVDSGSPEATELVDIARGSCQRLIRLINDLLDLNKIESGKMELKRSKIDVSELVLASLYPLFTVAQEAGIKLVHDREVNASIYADWDKSTQIITNLVSNAIKFSPPGSRVCLTTEVAEHNRIRFSVIDNGPGISEEDMQRLFEKFQQLDSSDTRQKGGTGLGLAISKALVEQHDGTIGVYSTPGQGSTFWFELPIYFDGVVSISEDQTNFSRLSDAQEVVAARSAERTLYGKYNQ